MTLLLLLALIIIIAYIAMVLLFLGGWRKIPEFNSSVNDAEKCNVSLVVAFRNEEINIPFFFDSLKLQTYRNFELILINDHSTDKTLCLLENEAISFDNVKIINAMEKGKKHAIAEGIKQSTGELIITTDADCQFMNTWVESIINYFKETKAEFISGPVQIKGTGSFFDDLQEIEFLSLVGSGAGAIGAGLPFMCNAANMAFKRKAWLQSEQELHFESVSGDDVFLLHSIKKRKGKIVFLKSGNAVVTTKAKENILEFINQRIRWSSKSKYYTDKNTISFSLIVFFTCLMQLFLIFFSFVSIYGFYLFFLFSFLKFLFDLLFLSIVNVTFKLNSIFKKALFLSLFYPFYIVFTALLSFLSKKNSW